MNFISIPLFWEPMAEDWIVILWEKNPLVYKGEYGNCTLAFPPKLVKQRYSIAQKNNPTWLAAGHPIRGIGFFT
jgi:hypothetical protein